MPPAVEHWVRGSAASFLLVLLVGVATGELSRKLGAVNINELPESADTRKRAHSLHPRDTSSSLRLALELETENDLQGAEAVLLHAARFDRQHLPAWSLANFYARRGEPAAFWLWARRAAALTPDDPKPLLRLCQQMEPSATKIALELGAGPRTLRALLDLLIGQGNREEAAKVAELLRRHHDPIDSIRLQWMEDLRASSE